MTTDIAPDAPTPETDAAVAKFVKRTYTGEIRCVDAEDMAVVERERNALQALIDGAKGELPPEPPRSSPWGGGKVCEWKDYDALRESAALAIAKERQIREAAEKENKVLRIKCANSLANNLCPDHRDKQTFKPCLACTIETTERQLAAANERVRALSADAERYRFLHECTQVDQDGYEWGVFRVMWSQGKPESVLATLSDGSDLDKFMELHKHLRAEYGSQYTESISGLTKAALARKEKP
jgi:hypothetical protein